ncbi:hypothetical protein [Leucobacter aridicollis]|uniref:Uncharacterized protein n=1 Tax=Leucobacter aridicollis TaxID=283878 RepID=A0A852RBL4_9MICO|nr:hypothetical protein [Leucobacter aridicollis]NYD26756.1 hypothetical protein [Leucobacter aridicollis]
MSAQPIVVVIVVVIGSWPDASGVARRGTGARPAGCGWNPLGHAAGGVDADIGSHRSRRVDELDPRAALKPRERPGAPGASFLAGIVEAPLGGGDSGVQQPGHTGVRWLPHLPA